MDPTKMKIVFVITKRNDKRYWNRVGVAFVNADGSMNVKLEAIPVNGELQIRDYVAKEAEEGGLLPARSSSNGHGAHEALTESA